MDFPHPTESVTVGSVEFSFQDINTVIDLFYEKVQHDPLLSVPFRSVHDWPHHVVRLTHFWWTRFGGSAYLQASYNPVEKHFSAGFNDDFLAHWLRLFQETLEQNLKREQADLWTLISQRMGGALSIKNEMYKEAMEEKA